MTEVLIVYHSRGGHTEALAKAVADGARSVEDTRVTLREAPEATLDDLRNAGALLLGSPVYHRSVSSPIKRFIEDVMEPTWRLDETVGKVGGVFTDGGGYGNTGAGVELTQLDMLAAMAANGMLIVPLPKTTPGFGVAGSHWGPHARTSEPNMRPVEVSEEMLAVAYHHGANVARVAQAVKGQTLFATGNVMPPEAMREQMRKELEG